MQLKVDMSKNKQESADLSLILAQVLEVYLKKLAEDSPEAFQQLVDGGGTGVVTELNATVGFRVKGQEELQYLTVDPHGSDHLEMLVVEAETDETGEPIWDTVKDNEHDSKFSDVEVLIAEGLPTEFEEIDSKYYSDQLEELDSVEVSDFTVVINELLDGVGKTSVVQYITGNALVSEADIVLTEGQKFTDIIDHYKQLL